MKSFLGDTIPISYQFIYGFVQASSTVQRKFTKEFASESEMQCADSYPLTFIS